MMTWLTIKDAARVLKMSEQGLYSAVREKQLPDAAVLRIGRRLRIDPTALVTREASWEELDGVMSKQSGGDLRR